MEKPAFIELYIADQYEKGVVDVLIKDDAKRLDEDDEGSGFSKLRQICDQTHGQIKHLYHRKHTSVQMTWLSTKGESLVAMDDFSSLFAIIILNYPNINFVFSYLSTKGEYVFSSQGLFTEFSKDELQDKETLMVFIDFLKKEINKVKVA
ncbi:MAG: hypothetical protein KAH25_06280 [Bacteroidales bacterium]|nr:hypothetical protein [Bacteroidales bacterium]